MKSRARLLIAAYLTVAILSSLSGAFPKVKYMLLMTIIYSIGAAATEYTREKKRKPTLNVEATKRSTSIYYLFIFLVCFTIRSIPEVIWWPWLIGFDTPVYVGYLKQYVENPTFLTPTFYREKKIPPPLLEVILLPLVKAGASPWSIYKVLPAILYGAHGAAATYYISEILKLHPRSAALASIILHLQLGSLRISQDLHRNMLGNIILLYTIPQLKKGKSKTIAALTALTALSHQLPLVQLLILIAAETIFKRNKKFIPSLAIATLLLLVYATPIRNELITKELEKSISEYWKKEKLLSNRTKADLMRTILSYILAWYWNILPLSILRARKLPRLHAIYLISTLSLVFLPILSENISFATTWGRWCLQLCIPLAMASAAEAIEDKLTFILLLIHLSAITLPLACGESKFLLNIPFKPTLYGYPTMKPSLPPEIQLQILQASIWIREHYDSKRYILILNTEIYNTLNINLENKGQIIALPPGYLRKDNLHFVVDNIMKTSGDRKILILVSWEDKRRWLHEVYTDIGVHLYEVVPTGIRS